MDIVDFAEKFWDVKLADWQKEHIRTLDKLGKNARIHLTMPRHLGREQAVYIYLNTKELVLDGKTNDCE